MKINLYEIRQISDCLGGGEVMKRGWGEMHNKGEQRDCGDKRHVPHLFFFLIYNGILFGHKKEQNLQQHGRISGVLC